MWSALGAFVILMALQANGFVSNANPLIVNYIDAGNGSPLNSSLMQLLDPKNYRRDIPPGFTDYGIGVYKFHKEALTWGKAMKMCEVEGAHLAIIDSQQEEDVLVSIFSRVPPAEIEGATGGTEYASIGVHDYFNEGEFMSVQGKPLSCEGFLHWAPNQPNGGDKENCIVMQRTGRIHDTNSAGTWAYICEFN